MKEQAENEKNKAEKAYSPLTQLAAASSFYLMYLKYMDFGFWPHLYAREPARDSAISGIVTAMWILSSIMSISLTYKISTRFFKENKYISIYVFFALIHGLLISMQPIRSIMLSLYYLIIILNTFAYVSTRNSERTMQEFTFFGIVIVLINYSSLAFPSQAFMISFYEGLFRGFTVHKNNLGYYLVPFITVYILGLFNFSKIMGIFLVVSIVVMEYMAQSAQAIIMIFGAFSVFLMTRVIPKRAFRVSIYFGVLYFALILLAAPGLIDATLGTMGKDSDLTGRPQIWQFFIDDIFRRNLFGYGLGVFFENADLVSDLKGGGVLWVISSAHSSYIEAAVALGILGGALFVLAIASGAYPVTMRFLRYPRIQAMPFCLMLFGVLGGLGATEKLFSPGFGWAVFIFSVTMSAALASEAVQNDK